MKIFALTLVFFAACSAAAAATDPAPAVSVDWSKTEAVSHTDLTIQVCPEPPLRRESKIHDGIWSALRDAKVNLARLQPWFPYPKIGVAELDPPHDGKTFWDFSTMDPIVEDFMQAAEGRPVMLNLGTIPQWMFVTDKPVPYPADPDEIDWNYGVGNTLRDPSMKELVGYYHRLASWYIKGGFNDEYGKWHESGHHYKIAYWEVLNEVDSEHTLTPKQYVAMYDAIVGDLHQIDPSMKFSGPALTSAQPEFLEYYLDKKNHQPGIPIDMVSYHFYTIPDKDESLEIHQRTIFLQAQTFLARVDHVQDLRRRVAPDVKTFINELGSMSADPEGPDPKMPDSYWTLAGSAWAYMYPRLVKEGVDYIGLAELIDYPGQFAATSVVNWNTGIPNARYWVMRLLKQNFGPGDKLVSTTASGLGYNAQGFVTSSGVRKVLLINMRDRDIAVAMPGASGGTIEFVDQSTGSNPPGSSKLASDNLTLKPQMVAVITLPQ